MTNRKFKAGVSREQTSFLPPSVGDYVEADNPVRAIEAYVGALNLARLGFRHVDSGGGAGQPPYHPADLLKLYLYGYLNQIRSSRRLEREAKRNKRDAAGKMHIRYAALRSVCGACPLRSRCLTDKARRRDIYRWEHQDVVDRHRARMAQPQADIMMRCRSALAEHPFGTLKCRAGYCHFLVRGFNKVRGEWGLMALAYNFTRVLNILGFDDFVRYLAAKAAKWALPALHNAATPALGVVIGLLARFSIAIAPNARICASKFGKAA